MEIRESRGQKQQTQNHLFKILLCDFNDDSRQIGRQALEEEGYQVRPVSDLDSLIQEVTAWQPDIILVDTDSMETTPEEMCKQLRNAAHNRALIAFLPPRKEHDLEYSVYHSGADAVIYKPLRAALFKSRINALLRLNRLKRKRSYQQVLDYGALSIDKEKCLVRSEDQHIPITRRELDLLLLLAHRPGKVYSREELFRQIWGESRPVNLRTIDVYINKLREKIGPAYIQTLRGVGYKFVLPRD